MPSPFICRPAFFTLTLLIGCGGSTHTPGDKAYAASVQPGTRAPSGPLQESILETLPSIEASKQTQISGHQVHIGAPYNAASGYPCRKIVIDPNAHPQTLLVCLLSKGWSFVPTIFPKEDRVL